jgi:hypothetical protein
MATRPPTLKAGDKGDNVKLLQRLLASQGSFDGAIGGTFGPLTKKAVAYFQMTHLGPNGKPLEVDGDVGKNTWWALMNPTGKPQRSGIVAAVPDQLFDARAKVLTVAVAEHKKEVHEIPDGSNWGGEVIKYLKAAGIGANAWCGCFWSWAHKEGLASFPMGQAQPHVQTAWNRAKSKGYAKPKAGYSPIPGDAFVYTFSGGTGHIGFVLSVDSATKARRFNTIEGNCGNRVKCGVRKVEDSSLVGFINVFGDEARDFETGIMGASDVGDAGTR